MTVRPLFVILGIVVVLMGVAWALQGAWIIPATFMRGPAWIGIGGAVAVVGLLIALLGWRQSPSAKA